MIKELDVPGTDIWKYVDDTSFSETISKNQNSHIQAVVDILANCASWISFNLRRRNTRNCIIIKFNTDNTSFDPVVVNGMPIDLVARAKILGFKT